MICAAMRQAYEANNLSVPAREQLLAIVGLSLPDAFRRLAATTSGDADHPVEALVTCYKNAFAELRSSVDHLEPLYPGAREAIDTLAVRPDTLLGIATGKSQRGVRAVLGRHGLAERFATIQTSDDAPSKPHPGMVLAAMRETGAAPRGHRGGGRHGVRSRDGARGRRPRDRRRLGLSPRLRRCASRRRPRDDRGVRRARCRRSIVCGAAARSSGPGVVSARAAAPWLTCSRTFLLRARSTRPRRRAARCGRRSGSDFTKTVGVAEAS